MSMTQSDKTKQNPVIYFQHTPCIDPITHWNNKNKCSVVAMVEFISKRIHERSGKVFVKKLLLCLPL